MKAFTVLISSVLLASPALAQTMNGGTAANGADMGERGDTPESTGSGDASTDGERRICRRIETYSGSRMAYRRVCRTADEWRSAQRGS